MIPLKYSSLLFSILGLAILFYLSTTLQPIYIALEDISNYEGREITAVGRITKYSITNYGEIIYIKENNTTIPIFLDGFISIHSGDYIEVTGFVKRYNDKWEIEVNDPRYISILSSWSNISTPLWEIARYPSKYIGLNLNVTGYIDSLYDKWLILSDENYSILVTFNNLNFSISPGSKVLLHAYFTYDPSISRYKFEIKNGEHFIREV